MKLFYTLLLAVGLCFSAGSSYAQPFTVKGSVGDTLNNSELPYASVSLIRTKDSILENFTRAKENGSFQLQARHTGRYKLLITFPNFADYIDYITLDGSSTVLDIGNIPMSSKTHLLNEFVVKQRLGAIKISGDTTAYVADSFKVRENASVEELLKVLPGIQVDKNGQVTAQGERVQKILVDGEEFFSDDPAVVTRSLQANAIDKVQVYDKKSDKAEFTGIDDGEKTKTINLQLKEDRKRGYFGKLDLGAGTNNFYENQAMINAFKGKRKISAFGIVSNTDKIGLGWQDKDKFGSGNNTQFDAESGNFFWMGNNNDDDGLATSWNGNYSGQGLPAVYTGGLHYSNKWKQDMHHLSSNYRFAKQDLNSIGNVLTIYSLPDSGSYTTTQKSTTRTAALRHRLDGLYEWKIDSMTSLKVTANGSISNQKTKSDFANEAHSAGGILLNDGRRLVDNDVDGAAVNAQAIFRRKFAKKGRTLSATFDENYKKTDGTGFLQTNNNFYENAVPIGSQIVDQKKTNYNEMLRLAADISYTEPLSKNYFLEFNYGLIKDNNTATRESYNKDATGNAYSVFDSLYSNSYDYDVLTNKGGMYLKYADKKVTASVGGAVSNAHFVQTDNYTSNTFTRNYTNFFPRVNFRYSPGAQQALSVNYYGSTQQPSLEQIQPLRQNTDPLNITIGNPNLMQEFRHTATINYHSYKMMTGFFNYVGGTGSFVNNAISQSQTVGIGGSRVSQYINVDGNYSSFFWAGFGKEFRKIGMSAGANANASFSKMITYVNNERNETYYNSYGITPRINYSKENKFNTQLEFGFNYNQNSSTINVDAPSYWSFVSDFDASYQLPLKFEIGTSFLWNVRERTVQFDRNNNVFRWNAYVSKKFLKNSQLELRLYVNDILNQNINYNRLAQDTYISERNYNTIQRYGMLKLIWNFTHTPKIADNGAGATDVMINN